MKKLSLAVCIAFALTGAVHAAGNPDAGKDKSTVCAACHGADGNSMVPMFPKLAGLDANYLLTQIQAFKAGDRQDPSMSPQVANLSDEDMADLAAYFASQTAAPGTVGGNAELGEKIYRAGNLASGVPACMACHGPSATGNPAAGYPALHSQQSTYTEKQLKDFRSGFRSASANAKVMQGVAAKMTDEEIAAVAGYIAGVK